MWCFIAFIQLSENKDYGVQQWPRELRYKDIQVERDRDGVAEKERERERRREKVKARERDENKKKQTDGHMDRL